MRKMFRDTVIAVRGCPVNGLVQLEVCKKCPYHVKYDGYLKRVECDKLTESEEKMKLDPSTDREYKTKW